MELEMVKAQKNDYHLGEGLEFERKEKTLFESYSRASETKQNIIGRFSTDISRSLLSQELFSTTASQDCQSVAFKKQSIGIVSVQHQDGSCSNGVGCLVGENIVITCAHILVKATKVTFICAIKQTRGLVFPAKEWRVMSSIDANKHLNIGLIFLVDVSAHVKCSRQKLPVWEAYRSNYRGQVMIFRFFARNYGDSSYAIRMAMQLAPSSDDFREYPCQVGSPILRENGELIGLYVGGQEKYIMLSWPILQKINRLSRIQYLQVTKYHNTRFTESVQKLRSVRAITLNKVALGKAGVSAIVRAVLPDLEELSLKKCGLNGEDVRELLKGQWPVMRKISLQRNPLGRESLELLCRTNWPCLMQLVVESHQLAGCSVLVLLKSCWPMLGKCRIAIKGMIMLNGQKLSAMRRYAAIDVTNQ